jgi:hypothetical protein
METASYTELPVPISQITKRHIAEDRSRTYTALARLQQHDRQPAVRRAWANTSPTLLRDV